MSLFSFFGFRKKSKVKGRATPLPASQRTTSASRPSVSSRSSDSPLVSNEAVIMASIIMSDDSGGSSCGGGGCD